MKVYIAAPYVARDTIRGHIAPGFEARGYTVTSEWINNHSPITRGHIGASFANDTEKVQASADMDLNNIDDSDVVVLLTAQEVLRHQPWLATEVLVTGGRHVEVGYALAKGKPVIVVGTPENVFARTLTHAQVDSWQAALDVLEQLEVSHPRPQLQQG